MLCGIPGKHSIKPDDPNSGKKKDSGSCLYVDTSLRVSIYLSICK